MDDNKALYILLFKMLNQNKKNRREIIEYLG